MLEYEQLVDSRIQDMAAKAEDKTAFYEARCHCDAWIAAAAATVAENLKVG